MNKKNNAGFSLVEVLVAIVILGILSAPVCTSLVLSTRMNVKATELLEAQLAVSSAVETLMAEGIDEAKVASNLPYYDEKIVDANTTEDSFPGIKVEVQAVPIEGTSDFYDYYAVKVYTDDGDIIVTTHIRKAGGT